MKDRLASLDVFRGLTIASMILVNNPGRWDAVYGPLKHAEWHGWTFTDTVFPFFVWIAGVAMTLSFSKRVDRGDNRGKLFLHSLRRAALIFALGLFLNGFPFFPLDRIRIPGVLQRIAVCYLTAATVFLVTRLRGQIAFTLFFLALYAALMGGVYDKDHNFARWVDGLALSGHMWSQTKVWDPEGIVSTLPAISTALFGVLTGHVLRSTLTPPEKTSWMFVEGVGLLALGHILSAWIPINKNLWTSSYSVFMAGLAAIEFATCYWLVDVSGWKKWTKPFAIYGVNAIAVYALSGVVARLLGLIQSGGASLEKSIFDAVFAPLAGPINASLLYAIANVLFLYAIAWLMYRRGWFVKL